MYDVTRKGNIEVYRVVPGSADLFLSKHVDEAEAIGAANNHGESQGGGLYRLKYPDKTVKVIVQGTAPSPPVINVASVAASFTQLDVIITTPASGVAPPFTYELEEALAAAGPFTVVAGASFTGSPLTYRRGGLAQGDRRYYRVRAYDSATHPQRVSDWSNVDDATIPIEQTGDWYPNWPTANWGVLQGASSGHILDATQHLKLSKHDGFMFQGFNLTPTRCALRKTNCAAIHALNTGGRRTRILLYVAHQQANKVESDSHMTPIINLINHPTKGNPLWWARRVTSGNQIEAPFNPEQFWLVNMGRSGLRNSLNQTYHTALMKEYKALLNASDAAHDVLSELDGLFLDDSHFRMQMPMSVGNGATVVTDPDIQHDGVAENITSYSAGPTGGSRLWCEGHQDLQAAIATEFGPDFMDFANCSETGSHYYDGDGTPPFPISSAHPMAGKVYMALEENVVRFGFGFTVGASDYTYNGGGSFFHCSRLVHIQKLMLAPDNQAPGGRAWVVIHFPAIDREPTQDDYEMCRFIFGFALIQERCASSVNRQGRVPIVLDEHMFDLGDPIGTRSIGTMNETNAVYTQRGADFSSGVGRFFFATFAGSGAGDIRLLLVRFDNPTVGAVYPDGNAAVTVPVGSMPSPGVGRKWQRFPSIYQHPTIDDFVTTGQSPLVNSGADVGAGVSMRPLTALVVRSVPI